MTDVAVDVAAAALQPWQRGPQPRELASEIGGASHRFGQQLLSDETHGDVLKGTDAIPFDRLGSKQHVEQSLRTRHLIAPVAHLVVQAPVQ